VKPKTLKPWPPWIEKESRAEEALCEKDGLE